MDLPSASRTRKHVKSNSRVFTWRPCDGIETTFAWKHALKSEQNPHALVLSRQNLTPQVRDDLGNISKGGYVLKAADQEDLTIIATGSEVGLAVDAAEILQEDNLNIKVVSMPCTELFDLQSEDYKYEVLGDAPKLVIEAGQPDFWHKYLNQGDLVLGINSYGESAPLDDLLVHFGFTTRKCFDFIKTAFKQMSFEKALSLRRILKKIGRTKSRLQCSNRKWCSFG